VDYLGQGVPMARDAIMGCSSGMVDRWDPSNGGIASKVRGGLFNSAEHLVKFIAGMYRDACIPNEHYWFFAKNGSVG
jgi:hypothetical protein